MLYQSVPKSNGSWDKAIFHRPCIVAFMIRCRAYTSVLNVISTKQRSVANGYLVDMDPKAAYGQIAINLRSKQTTAVDER